MPNQLPEFFQAWLEQSGERSPLLVTSPSSQPLDEALSLVTEQKENATVVEITSERITIKDIRGIISEAAHTSWADHRIVIIPQAERLTDPAANALLKLLEEGSAHTSFILLSQWPTRLLETIRSRCARVRLPASRSTKQSVDLSALNQSLLQRLTDSASDKALSTDELDTLGAALEQELRASGPSPALRRAFTRLRDYHKIAAQQGNTKLAKDVLLASLPENG